MQNGELPKNLSDIFANMYKGTFNLHSVEDAAKIVKEVRECHIHGSCEHTIYIFDDGYQEVECTKCRKEIEEEEEAKLKEQMEKDAIKRRENFIEYCKSCNIEPEFYDLDFENFEPKTKSQERAFEYTKKLVQDKHGKLVLLGKNGVGKEEWVEQIIPTPQGFRRFGDLQVGDYVYDDTGKPTKVLGIFPQGIKDSYKVTFADGRSDECGLEHLWGVYTRSHGKFKYQVLSLNEMLKKGIKGYKGTNRFYIPASPVIDCKEKELPCDPYILGSFIGNGCCKDVNLALSSNDEWQVKKCADILGCSPLKYHSNNYTWYFKNGKSLLKTRDILPKEICCLANEKYIPQEYFFASEEQRKALLQGLFDTDGHAGAYGSRLHITYSSCSKRLAEDIRTLLFTFGIVSSVITSKREGKNDCFIVSVNCSVEKARLLFSLPRKLAKVNDPKVKKGSHRDYSVVGIKSVEKLPEKKEMMCIWVENESHLYLTKDFLVTHNTMLASIAAKKLGGKVYSMYEISTMIRQSYTVNATRTELEIVNELASIPFLAIDELGRTKGSDTEHNWLSYILDKRHVRRLPFMLLSNGHFKKECKDKGCPMCFENFMDSDVLSRLRQDSAFVSIDAPDRRDRRNFGE